MDEKVVKPLRIAMVTDMVPGQAGGSYISALRFAQLLQAKGHRVILVAAKDSRQPATSEYEGVPAYQYPAFPIPGSHRFYFQSFPRKRQLHQLFKDEQIDIVHIMFPSYSCWLAKRVARDLGLPLVAHIHTQPENVIIFFPSFLRTPFVRSLVLRFLAWFVRGAKRIICPSELGKNIYHSVDHALPITVLSNGVNLADFHPVPTAKFMEKFGLAMSDRHLLFIGRLAADKDPMTLLRAVPSLVAGDPRIHVSFMSTGPLMQPLKDLAQVLGVEKHVTFLGRVSDEDRLAAYSACDLFVLPSHVELEGMVVLEAMALGKPILIANAPMSASKYFVRDNGLLFEPGNAKDLADKALQILTNDEERARMGARSREIVQEYDIHASAAKLEEIYYSVLPII